ncbi:MAG: deoxyribose-phosphate aldolase [Firmicutes bacterium]|nr:deoxyribose-phosphate aldolase [Bacillota bacterium]
MKARDIAQLIDHSLLRPNLTLKDVKTGCLLAKEYDTASCCVRPADVKIAAELLQGSSVALSTVIGFPHGTTTKQNKLAECREAVLEGVVELDVVMNFARLLSGDIQYVTEEIHEIVAVAHSEGAIVKVILETCYLNEKQKKEACRICREAGADFVKTSTGFGTKGAVISDLLLMQEAAGPNVKIKAAGGIRDLDAALAVHKAGAHRIGATATKVIMDEAINREKAGTLIW